MAAASPPLSPRSPRSLAAVASEADDVQQMLRALKLDRYWPSMRDEGYDDLATLLELDDEEIEEMVGACSMKRGHAIKLKKAIQGLRASSDPAADSGPGSASAASEGTPGDSTGQEMPISRRDSGSLRRAMTFSSRTGDLHDALDSTGNDGGGVAGHSGASSKAKGERSAALGGSGGSEAGGAGAASAGGPGRTTSGRQRAAQLMDAMGTSSLDTAVTVLKAVTRM